MSDKTQETEKVRDVTKKSKRTKKPSEKAINKQKDFRDVLTEFIINTSSLKDSYPITVDATRNALIKGTQDFHNYLKSKEEMTKRVAIENSEISIEERREYDEVIDRVIRMSKRMTVAMQSPVIISRSFIVSLVSQFDSLVGSLVKLLHEKKPELLNSSNKQITFSDLLGYRTIEDARKDVLDTEIDKVLYKSRKEQIDYLADKSDVKLFNYLPDWKDFLEVTERRNLFVHANGIVSQKYIDQCKDAGSSLTKKTKVGERLEVSEEYYNEAYKSVVEAGVIISVLIWRKIDGKSQSLVDGTIVEMSYEMISNEEYGTALKLLEFAHTPALSKGRDEHMELVMLINLAQTYKWMGNKNKMQQTLSRKTWSTLRDNYRMAEEVLTDNFGAAARLLKHLAETEGIERKDLRTWPLFKEFRKTDEFRTIYKEVYGQPFSDEQNAHIEEIERISQAEKTPN